MANIFKEDTESVLVKGLKAMTKACEALSIQNESLATEIEGLNGEVSRLKERILSNTEERE